MKQSKLKKVLSILLCLSLMLGFVPPIQAQDTIYQVDLNRGISLVPTDLTTNDSFMDRFVRNNGDTLSLNHLFQRVGYDNVKNSGSTLSTNTMQRNRSDYWWAKYQWTPNEVEKQYLADSNYPLIYEGNVIPHYCTHTFADDHWCQACVRLTSNDWNFGDQDRWGGNFHWYVHSENHDDGDPQKVKEEIASLTTTTLTFAAYSQKHKNCGNPKVSGSVFYMVDTTVPYITDVAISGGSYQSLADGDVTGTVTLTFSEDIRLANNQRPSGLKLNLDAYYGAQAGGNRNENTSYSLSADFSSLVGNQMTFTFTVPKSVNHIYITGISNDQPMLESCELYVYDGNGNQLSNTGLTSPTMITDLSGNYLRWDKSDKTCSTVTYDGVAPTLTNVSMSGPDISAKSDQAPSSWEENSGNNRYVYAGVGDRISFALTYSENVNVPSDAKAVLSITDASGNPIRLGIKSHRGNTVVFQDLTITEGMLEAGERIIIEEFENLTVTDYAGNALSGNGNMTPAQDISLDVDKPVISTKLAADDDGVYTPYADTEGEYFTVPLKFAEAKNGNATYSGVSGKEISFALEMLDGDAYGYQWYIDNTQQVDKNAKWNNATTGTAKNTVEDIADDKDYYLHIKLDKNTDYNYTDGGVDDSGIFFKGRLTVQASDWAGNQAAPAVYTLKHQVDTEAPVIRMTARLRMEPNYGNGNVTFSAAFQTNDNYSIKRITCQWFYRLGAETDFTARETVTLSGETLGTGLNKEYTTTLSNVYDYALEENPDSGACYLVVTVEDRLGKTATITYNTVSFNFTKAKSTSAVVVNSATDPVKYPSVTLNAPTYEEDGNYSNTPRTILLLPDTRSADRYWLYDPWEYGHTDYPDGARYGTDIFQAINDFAASGSTNIYNGIPGWLYYVTAEVDLENNSGSFVRVEDVSATISQTGCLSDLQSYLDDFYGPLDLHLVTTSSLEEFSMSSNPTYDVSHWELLNFESAESVIDTYTVYLAGDIDLGVENITVENSEVLNYTSGVPAKNLDNATVSFRIVNTTDTDTVQYGLGCVDYANANVKLYYLGQYSNADITDSTELIQSWNLEPSADGTYTLTVEPGRTVKNGWYKMVLTLPNSYTGETNTFSLANLFMDATVLDITLDGYYKAYDHEDLYLSGHYGLTTAWDKTGLEASYAAGEEIILGLDTAPEGWTMDTHLTFQAGGRSKENDPLYWQSFDVAPRVRVYNHTYNAAAGLEDVSSGLWLTSDDTFGATFSYVPYLAAADAAEPYGTADSLKLPFVEGYNVLVYEIESINGIITTKEITVNVFGQAESWELDTIISSVNGVGVNSVTASAVYPSSSEKLRFSYLDSRYTYYQNSYVFTSDMDTTTFYLIDDQGNLSTRDFALLDENGNLVDVDGNEPDVFVRDLTEGSYATFVAIISATDDDSRIDPRDLTLTFDAAYTAALLGLDLEDPTSSTYELTIPVPLALDENGELLRNADGTYPVWESYETGNYGIYRTQVISTEPTQEEMENYGYEDCVEIKIWGAWKPEFSDTVTLTANAEDSYGNRGSADESFYASAWMDISHMAMLEAEDERFCYVGCEIERHIDIDKKLTSDGELAIALRQPVAAIDGCGIRQPMTEGYTLGQHEKYYVTTAPMIVEDGVYTVKVTDLFGDVHTLEMYVDCFGELGIDVHYSTTEPTNQSVTVTAQATGEYDRITSITSNKGDVGAIDGEDPTKASITVSDNCAITIETEDGMSRIVQVSNIDKVLDEVRIVYYDQRYEVLDPEVGAESVTARLVCDTEVVYVTNGPSSYNFPMGSKAGDTYTFEYQDAAGNTGTVTATLPCDLAALPEEGDTAAPDIQVNLYALVGGRYCTVADVANPGDGSELNVYLNEGKSQGFRLVFTINDAGATKVLVRSAGTEAPTDYASAEQGSTVEDAALSVSGRSATVTVSANTTFDVHIIDEKGNVKSVPNIAVTTIDNQAPVLTPVYVVGRDENGYPVVEATFYPSEEEKFEVITPLSSDAMSKEVQIGTEVVDEETGETAPIMAKRYYHIFTTNGTYTFTYQDEMGNIGTAVAVVRNLNTDAPTVRQVNWYGTESPMGQSNVTPDKSGMVNRSVIAQLRMNMAISDVKLYAYDSGAKDHAGAPLDAGLPVDVSFTATTIDVTYRANVAQKIVVEYTASESGRKGYYELAPVNCIDKEAPVVTVTDVQMAGDNRSVVITFETSEETVMSLSSSPAYGKVHTWTATDNRQVQIRFIDKAGNQTVYTLTENAGVDTLKLSAEFSLNADGTGATADPLNDLKPDAGAKLYLRVNKSAEVVLAGAHIGKVDAGTWTEFVLPDAGGLHILSLTDVSTGELLQILVAAQPKDNVAPVIELESNTVLVTEKASADELLAAVNAGVTVTDDEDQNPHCTVTGYPDTVEAGLYILTYTAADDAGNVSTVSRTLYIMAEGTPLLKINGEVGVPYDKVFLKNGGESTDITLELINMEQMTGQPLVIKYRKGEHTTAQMKYSATTVEDMRFTVTDTGHYTIYVRSQDRVEFVIYIYVEG